MVLVYLGVKMRAFVAEHVIGSLVLPAQNTPKMEVMLANGQRTGKLRHHFGPFLTIFGSWTPYARAIMRYLVLVLTGGLLQFDGMLHRFTVSGVKAKQAITQIRAAAFSTPDMELVHRPRHHLNVGHVPPPRRAPRPRSHQRRYYSAGSRGSTSHCLPFRADWRAFGGVGSKLGPLQGQRHSGMGSWTNVKLPGNGSVRIDGAYWVHPAQAAHPPEEQRWILWFLGNGEVRQLRHRCRPCRPCLPIFSSIPPPQRRGHDRDPGRWQCRYLRHAAHGDREAVYSASCPGLRWHNPQSLRSSLVLAMTDPCLQVYEMMMPDFESMAKVCLFP